MITELTKTYQEITNEFKDAITNGINGFVRAGEIYVKAIDQDPEYADKMQLELGNNLKLLAENGYIQNLFLVVCQMQRRQIL